MIISRFIHVAANGIILFFLWLSSIPPELEVRGGGREELPHTPKPEAKGGGREEQPHVQGAEAVWAQEGLEELSHIEGQEGRR